MEAKPEHRIMGINGYVCCFWVGVSVDKIGEETGVVPMAETSI